MPRQTQGEQISGLQATVDAFREYETEKWHKLANDLQPLMQLPERLTRDVAKIDAKVEVRINAVAKEIERSVLAAIKEAVAPIKKEMAELRTDVDALKALSNKLSGARILLIFLMNMLAGLAAGFGGASWFSRGHP